MAVELMRILDIGLDLLTTDVIDFKEVLNLSCVLSANLFCKLALDPFNIWNDVNDVCFRDTEMLILWFRHVLHETSIIVESLKLEKS